MRFAVGGNDLSTRVAGGRTMQVLAANIPELVGGAADVQSSTETHLGAFPDVARHDWAGRNLHFGVREHAMAAVINGIAAHGGLRPFAATFTHDSIGLGEDGTTHQPVEQRATAGSPLHSGESWTRPGE